MVVFPLLSADVNIDRRAVIVMCADNGIVEESVTQTGQEVTAIVSCNMADGISSVCRMAAYANADKSSCECWN